MNRILAGESVLSLVEETPVPEQALNGWKHQAPIDQGLVDGVNFAVSTQLQAAS